MTSFEVVSTKSYVCIILQGCFKKIVDETGNISRFSIAGSILPGKVQLLNGLAFVLFHLKVS